MAVYFPVAIQLEGKRCVVVGGGSVAARRVENLLDAGGVVTVVAPEVLAEIREWAARGLLEVVNEPYRDSHLDGAFLAVAATNQPAVNETVAEAARERGILCNDAESGERGDFIVPAIVRRGDLLITVTASGKSPSLTARIRDELATQYGPEYSDYVAILGEVRAHALATISDARRRRAALNAVAHNRGILDLIRDGRLHDARAEAFSCISSLLD